MRLTKSTIVKLQPHEQNTLAFWDDQTRGFGYRLYPSGRAAFVVRYRLVGSRKQRVVVIGDPSGISIDQARVIAAKHLAAARAGVDLMAETAERVREAEEAKQAKAARVTVREAVESYFSWFKAGIVARTGRGRSPASIKAEGAWTAHFAKTHGRKALADVTARDIRDLLDGLPVGSQNAVHGAIGRVMRWAMRYELIQKDPTAAVKPPAKPQPRDRTPAISEVQDYLALIERLSAGGGLRQASADYLTFIALTGQRRHEVALMRWADIDMDAREWRQPPTANKSKRPHVVPLGPRAIAILQRRRAHAAERDGLVLPGPNSGGPQHGNADNLMERLQTAGVSFKLHDLRRAMVSAMADHGVAMEVADSLLNHAATATRGGITGVYQRSELKAPKRRAIELWERLLFEEPAEVIPLRRESA